MKRIFLFILFFASVIIAVAQPPVPGSTRHTPQLDKYVGTWLWQNTNESIEIKFKKVYYYSSVGDITEDLLFGVHKYVKNGIVIEDYLPLYNDLGQNTKGSLYIWVNWHNPNPDELMGTVRDVLKHNSQYIYLNYMGGNPLQMKCVFAQKGTVIVAPTLEGKTLPDGELVFTKQ